MTNERAGGLPPNPIELRALRCDLPPDLGVLSHATKLALESDSLGKEFVLCVYQDPSIVLEFFASVAALDREDGKRTPVSSLHSAIIRLGITRVRQTLAHLKERSQFEEERFFTAFEVHRSFSKRSALIARMLAQILCKNASDDCQACALFSSIGEMLALFLMKNKVLNISTSEIHHIFEDEHSIPLKKIAAKYLAKRGIPKVINLPYDLYDGREKNLNTVKLIALAANELVTRFDNGNWDEVAPGKAFPPESTLRKLKFVDSRQYTKLYERASEYLFKIRFIEAKQREAQKAFQSGEAYLSKEIELIPPPNSLSVDTRTKKVRTTVSVSFKKRKKVLREGRIQARKSARTLERNRDDFGLKNKGDTTPAAREAPLPKLAEIPDLLALKSASSIVNRFTEIIESAKSSEELLSSLLLSLIDNGPFEKTALIVISKDRKNGIVVAARGPNIGNGQKLVLDDPLSPLSQCFSKIQSYGKDSSTLSPFGSKTYAVAPIDAQHQTPVALYADCGNEGSITFEARRVFRVVVDLANKKIRSLPGGIPVEI